MRAGAVAASHALHLRSSGGRRLIQGSPWVAYDIEDGPEWHREIIRPGAFARSLAGGADVRCLWNHDPKYVLGRSRAGTLRLRDTSTGLHGEVDPPATGWATDLLASMARGDISGASFQFRTVRARTIQRLDLPPLREILEAELVDVSVVTFPWYEAAASEAVEEDAERMAALRSGWCPPAAELLRAVGLPVESRWGRFLAERRGPDTGSSAPQDFAHLDVRFL